MLTHFDYEVLNKKIDTLSEKVETLSLLVDKLLGDKVTADYYDRVSNQHFTIGSTGCVVCGKWDCIGSRSNLPCHNVFSHALSSGSFTDAGIEQTWRSNEYKTK